MSYCVAFSEEGATDVTRRYVCTPEYVLPRQRCSEARLRGIIDGIRRLRQHGMPDDRRLKLSREESQEDAELQAYFKTDSTVSGLKDESLGHGERSKFQANTQEMRSGKEDMDRVVIVAGVRAIGFPRRLYREAKFD